MYIVEDKNMKGIQNKKRMYDYCCQRIICHKEILSRIIQEYVDEAKKRDKNNKQDVRCYFNLKECIQINIYLNLDYKEDAHVNKRKKHKVYHLYFITRSLEYDDGTVLMNINSQLNIYKSRIYISNRYRSNNECKQHNEILTLMHIILSY